MDNKRTNKHRVNVYYCIPFGRGGGLTTQQHHQNLTFPAILEVDMSPPGKNSVHNNTFVCLWEAALLWKPLSQLFPRDGGCPEVQAEGQEPKVTSGSAAKIYKHGKYSSSLR